MIEGIGGTDINEGRTCTLNCTDPVPNPHDAKASQTKVEVPHAPLLSYGPSGDAGAKARTALHKRSTARRVASFFTKLYLVVLTLTFVGIAGFGYWGYQHKVKGFLVDERSCSYTMARHEVTGKRKYSYGYTEYFGFRVIDTTAIGEETRIDIRGDGMLIVGNTKGDFWSNRVKEGERGVQLLKNHETYTFIFDNDVGVVQYSDLCK